MSVRRIEINGTQVVASVLATVTGAVAASYLGVAGTLIGAAVMSVASTAGSAIYKHYLGRTARRLREAAPVITHRTTQRAAAVGAQSTARRLLHPEDSERTLPIPALGSAHEPGEPAAGAAEQGARERIADDPGAGGRGAGLRARPGWLLGLGAAAGIFLTVIVAITVFELAAGKPLGAVVWHRHGSGTSVGQIVGGQPAAHSSPASHRTSPASRAPSTPVGTPTSTSPSPSPSSSSATPSGSPSPTPTGTGSPVPSSPAATPRL